MNKGNNVNWTPLHAAAASGKADMFLWLLKHGARPGKMRYTDWTPMHVVWKNKDEQIGQLIKEFKFDFR